MEDDNYSDNEKLTDPNEDLSEQGDITDTKKKETEPNLEEQPPIDITAGEPEEK
jgi:hypothetical protein